LIRVRSALIHRDIFGPAMKNGLFITFEGTEGSGKSTQIERVAQRLQENGRVVKVVREPGGTSIGEEIRHTLKHSQGNRSMTPEAELLLINASRAQLVREIIEPALDQGVVVVCDRFSDSSIAYQGYGRGLDLETVRRIIGFATGMRRPDLTLLLAIPLELSETRRAERGPGLPTDQAALPLRDRFEEADRAFFERVEKGYLAIAREEPDRVRLIDGAKSIETVTEAVWTEVVRVVWPNPQG
jgi:dTMP kinase